MSKWVSLGECQVGFAGRMSAMSKPEPSDALYSAYCAWHSSKGYWPKETPMGELIPGFDKQGTL